MGPAFPGCPELRASLCSLLHKRSLTSITCDVEISPFVACQRLTPIVPQAWASPGVLEGPPNGPFPEMHDSAAPDLGVECDSGCSGAMADEEG